jgi:hypothetical protein
MPRGKAIDGVLAEAEQIARIWTSNPDFAMSDVTLAQLQTKITDLRQKRTDTETIRTQLTEKINDANGQADALNRVVTRARTGFRAFYGPDSTQYEQAGGKRASERKPRSSKKKGGGQS